MKLGDQQDADAFGRELRLALVEYKKKAGEVSSRMWEEECASFYKKWVARYAKKKTKPVKVGTGPGTNIPPTAEEVRAYHDANGFTFSVDKFMAHYTSNGWRVGKNPMKNWHGCCVTFQGDLPRRPVNGAVTQLPGEPSGWREFVRLNYTAGAISTDKDWAALSPDHRKWILEDMRKASKQLNAG